RVWRIQVRIERIDGPKGRLRRRPALRRVGQIAVLELDRLQIGWVVQRPEEDVAVRTIEEEAQSAANRSLVVEWRPGKSEPRSEQVLPRVEASRRAGGNALGRRGVGAWNPPHLIARHTRTGANQPVVGIPRAWRNQTRRRDDDGAGRIVEARVEVAHVIRRGIERS